MSNKQDTNTVGWGILYALLFALIVVAAAAVSAFALTNLLELLHRWQSAIPGMAFSTSFPAVLWFYIITIMFRFVVVGSKNR